MQRLPLNEWQARQRRHRDRLHAPLTERSDQMAAGLKHPVQDFLFSYYSFRPGHLQRWSPGAEVFLEGAKRSDLDWGKEYETRENGLILSARSFPTHRLSFLEWAIGYFRGIAERPPSYNCFGLHEWAMVYRAPEVRHAATPLRLSREEIARVVDAEGLRCTHYDAYRFFTPEAVPLNRLPLARTTTVEHDQKGCLHVAMDLYRYAFKIAPWTSGELVADAFFLAREARTIDMRASPYDLRAFGLEPIRIESREGREEYVELQRELSHRAEPLRERLIGEYQSIRRHLQSPAQISR